MKSRFVLQACSVVLFLVLGLILPWGASPAEAAVVEITFGGANRTSDDDVMAMFNESYAGEIEVEGLGMNLDSIIVAIVGGVPPDVALIDRFQIASLASSGFLLPLDDLIARDGIDPDDFFPPAWDECVFDGKVYCIPRSTDTRVMWYNKTMFTEHGLDQDAPPRTFSEVMEVSRRLTTYHDDGRLRTVGLVAFWGNWGWPGWLWAGGGEVLDPTNRIVTWNRPEAIRTMEWMRELVNFYGGEPAIVEFGRTGAHLIRRGVQGFEVSVYNYWDTQLKDVPEFEYGAAYPPRADGLEDEAISWSGGYGLAIPVGVQNVEEAWEFIKFFVTPEAQVAVSTTDIPVVRGVATSPEVLDKTPHMPTIISLMPYSRYRPPVPVSAELFDIYGGEIMNRFRQGEPTESILYETAERAQRILDEGWAAYEQRRAASNN